MKTPVDPKVAFIKAFLKLQTALPTVVRTATNEQTDSQYAPLEDVLTPELKALLSKHGFALWHRTHETYVEAMLVHVGGYESRSAFVLRSNERADLTDSQARAAAITMGRRYTTFDVLGLVQSGSDRDGQAQPRQTMRLCMRTWVPTGELQNGRDTPVICDLREGHEGSHKSQSGFVMDDSAIQATALPPEPAGYGVWLEELRVRATMSTQAQVIEHFAFGPIEFRNYLVTYMPEAHEELKRQAGL
jgi:hypothetical protein